MPFVKVAKAADVAPGQLKGVQVGGVMLALANVEGTLYAFESLCTHAEGWLHEGFLDGHEVTCPVHFGAFDVRSGDATYPPAYLPVATYPVRVNGEDVEIDVPADLVA
jgi:nitrite reductase/ring-hydroxylating ferredoxin subunit